MPPPAPPVPDNFKHRLLADCNKALAVTRDNEQTLRALLAKLRAGVLGKTTNQATWANGWIISLDATSYFEAQRELDATLRNLKDMPDDEDETAEERD
jgi:hypothetical protein